MKKQLALVAALAGLFAAGSANALLIDDFTTTPSQNIIVTNVGSVGTVVADGSVLGGYRDLTVNQTANADPGNARSRGYNNIIDPLNTYFSGSNEDGVDSTMTLLWNANGAGLGDVDMTDGGNATGFYIKLLAADLDVSLTFMGASNSGVSSKTIIFPANVSNYDLFVTFASFTGSANFTELDALSLTMNGPAAWDARIAFIRTEPNIPTPPSVPEPATLGLLGLGLLGLGLSRRKRA